MSQVLTNQLPAPTARVGRITSTVAGQRPLPCVVLALLPSHSSQRSARALLGVSTRRSQPSGRRHNPTQCFAVPASVPRDASFVTSSFLVDMPTAPNNGGALRPLPRAVENVADDPRLANPLARQERMGTGWLAVIMEYEGLVVEDYADLHQRAWESLAVEESKSLPPGWMLRRAEGMKNEQVIQEVFCWTRLPMEVRRLAARKEDLFREALGDTLPAMPPGAQHLLDLLSKHNVPVAIACSAPDARVRDTLQQLQLQDTFGAIITADDVYRGRPDPESYLLAAQQLGRPPARCVVIGNSNASVEAAREAGMAAVVVAGRTPMYELSAADLIVRQLSELSFVNLKQLFRNEELASNQDPELELELEVEAPQRQNQTMLRERF